MQKKFKEKLMNCEIFDLCGGCAFRHKAKEQYLLEKFENFKKIISSIYDKNIKINDPVFISDGCRRRATFAFQKGKIGFNALKSHQIISLNACPALVKPLSDFLPKLQELIKQFKGSGEIAVLNTPFGIDMHIKRSGVGELTLNQREILAEFYYSEGNFDKAEQFGKIIERKEENYTGLIDKIMAFFAKK